jgi:uncharacterized phiE125 gp8 family phage protein
MTLITVTPPAVEPVTLDEMKAQVRQDFSNDDVFLSSCIVAARAFVENFTRRRLITQVVEFRRDGLGGVIRLPVAPIQSVTSITYLDSANTEQVLATDLWRVRKSVDPWQIIPAHLVTWPTVLPDLDTVGITMTVGYGDAGSDVPADIRAALKSMAAHFYENREGVIVGTSAAEMPLAVRDLLMPHVLWD